MAKKKYMHFGYALYIKDSIGGWHFYYRYDFRKDAVAEGVRRGRKFRVEGIRLDATPISRFNENDATQ